MASSVVMILPDDFATQIVVAQGLQINISNGETTGTLMPLEFTSLVDVKSNQTLISDGIIGKIISNDTDGVIC